MNPNQKFNKASDSLKTEARNKFNFSFHVTFSLVSGTELKFTLSTVSLAC